MCPQVISPSMVSKLEKLIFCRAIIKLTSHVKIRTYSKSNTELWLDEWRNPLSLQVPVQDPSTFMAKLREPVNPDDPDAYYVHKLGTGFLVWSKTVKAYRPVGSGDSPFTWEEASQPALQAMKEFVTSKTFFSQLAVLFGQESSKNPTTLKLRTENVVFIKSLGMSSTANNMNRY